jgi:hypothetical protein
MTFGMPRALFAVLSVSTFHTGAVGTGVLYAEVSAGATVGALTTGWLESARRLGSLPLHHQPDGDPRSHAWPDVVGVLSRGDERPAVGGHRARRGGQRGQRPLLDRVRGLLCLVGVAVIGAAFPALGRYDADRWVGEPATGSA